MGQWGVPTTVSTYILASILLRSNKKTRLRSSTMRCNDYNEKQVHAVTVYSNRGGVRGTGGCSSNIIYIHLDINSTSL